MNKCKNDKVKKIKNKQKDRKVTKKFCAGVGSSRGGA
jgi:hypothetical protein